MPLRMLLRPDGGQSTVHYLPVKSLAGILTGTCSFYCAFEPLQRIADIPLN